MNKILTEEEVVTQIKDGMTIGVGGWGSRRKPMSLILAIIRAGIKDLTVVSYGGPEIGLLSATGQLRKAIYGFVSLDSIPLEPHFRVARQTGEIEATELDEGAFYLGLMAAAHRVPFYPTRAGLGSDMLEMNPELKLVESSIQLKLLLCKYCLSSFFLQFSKGLIKGGFFQSIPCKFEM